MQHYPMNLFLSGCPQYQRDKSRGAGVEAKKFHVSSGIRHFFGERRRHRSYAHSKFSFPAPISK